MLSVEVLYSGRLRLTLVHGRGGVGELVGREKGSSNVYILEGVASLTS